MLLKRKPPLSKHNNKDLLKRSYAEANKGSQTNSAPGSGIEELAEDPRNH